MNFANKLKDLKNPNIFGQTRSTSIIVLVYVENWDGKETDAYT